MKSTCITLTIVALIATAASAGELTARAVIRQHVKPDGQVDATLASHTGWSNVQGFSWKMYLVDDLSGTATATLASRPFKTEQAFKFRVEAYTDLWVYVMNVEPNGNMVTLMPERGEQHLLVKAGESVHVPPDGHFRFVGDPGVEKFRIIASPKKLEWVNPAALWKLENGARLRPDEQRVAMAQAGARTKSIESITSVQKKRQENTGGLYEKDFRAVVQALSENPSLRGRTKDVVLLPPPAEGAADGNPDNEDVEDPGPTQEVILVSDDAENSDSIVIDIKLKHGQ